MHPWPDLSPISFTECHSPTGSRASLQRTRKFQSEATVMIPRLPGRSSIEKTGSPLEPRSDFIMMPQEWIKPE